MESQQPLSENHLEKLQRDFENRKIDPENIIAAEEGLKVAREKLKGAVTEYNTALQTLVVGANRVEMLDGSTAQVEMPEEIKIIDNDLAAYRALKMA